MICSNKVLLAFLLPYGAAFTPQVPSFQRSISLDMTKKVFIDGEAGTTGLQVRDRLSKRDDIEIISPPSELRKDEDTRKKLINEADAVILCKLSNFKLMYDLCVKNIFCNYASITLILTTIRSKFP